MDYRQKVIRAAELVAAANAELQGDFVQLSVAADTVTLIELAAQARKLPGAYTCANLFRAIKGRAPTRSEAVRLGQLLAALQIPKRNEGGTALWSLASNTFGA